MTCSRCKTCIYKSAFACVIKWAIDRAELAPSLSTPSTMADRSESASDSPQVKLLYEHKRGFESRNLDAIAKNLHKDFRYICYPRSLGYPEQTKEEWITQFSGYFPHWTDMQVNSLNINLFSDYPTFFADNHPFHHRGSREGCHSRSYHPDRSCTL
jgi:hypothetical protein